jgi:hypothetical protein
MRDQELLLRFLALYLDGPAYSKPMKRFLNTFMNGNRNLEKYDATTLTNLVRGTCDVVLSSVGPEGLRRGSTLNAAVFDSTAVGLARRLERGPIADLEDVRSAHKALLEDPDYESAVSLATSDDDSVQRRISLAQAAFAAIE